MRKCPNCGYEEPKPRNDKRNRQITERRNNGETLSAIATDFGISKGRVRQIVIRENREGVTVKE